MTTTIYLAKAEHKLLGSVYMLAVLSWMLSARAVWIKLVKRAAWILPWEYELQMQPYFCQDERCCSLLDSLLHQYQQVYCNHNLYNEILHPINNNDFHSTVPYCLYIASSIRPFSTLRQQKFVYVAVQSTRSPASSLLLPDRFLHAHFTCSKNPIDTVALY